MKMPRETHARSLFLARNAVAAQRLEVATRAANLDDGNGDARAMAPRGDCRNQHKSSKNAVVRTTIWPRTMSITLTKGPRAGRPHLHSERHAPPPSQFLPGVSAGHPVTGAFNYQRSPMSPKARCSLLCPPLLVFVLCHPCTKII